MQNRSVQYFLKKVFGGPCRKLNYTVPLNYFKLVTVIVDVNMVQNPQKTGTRFGCIGFLMRACGISVPQMLQFCLFSYSSRSKWASSEIMIFFAKIRIFCKSISGPLSEAYTQSYSFGGRIKLIICHIRHNLSVTIHEISTSWKNVRWRTLYKEKNKLISY